MRQFLIYIILLFNHDIAAQAFQKAINPDIILYALPSELTERPDGNFVLSYAIADNNGGFCMACLDPQGNPVWAYQYLMSQVPIFKMDHCATSDNGCVASMFFGNNKMLVKIDADGQVEWTKRYSVYNSCYEPAEQLVSFAGGFVLKVDNCVLNFTGGLTESTPLSLLVGYDNAGNVLWEKNTVNLYTLPQMVPAAFNNTILVAFARDTSAAGKNKGQICSLNPQNGALQQIVVLPDLDIKSMYADPTGAVYFSAQTPDEKELLLGKVANQQIQWLKRVENSGFKSKIARCSRVFLSGSGTLRMSLIWNNAVTWLNFDTDGNFIDAVAYAYPFIITCTHPVIQCSDGGLAWFINDGFRKEMYFAKTSPSLQFNCPSVPTCDFSIQNEPFQSPSAPVPQLKDVSQMVEGFVSTLAVNINTAAYCPPPQPLIDPTILFTDTVRCTGIGFSFKRRPDVFGNSTWTFESGIPAIWELSSTPIVQFPGTGTYLVRHELNQLGCVVADSLYVRLLPPPSLDNQDTDFDLCPGDSLTFSLDIPADWSVRWNNADTALTRIFTKGGKYEFTLESGEGCFSKDTVVIDEQTLPRVSVFGDTLYCSNSGGLLKAFIEGAYTDFYWENSDIDITQLTVAQSGWYVATAVNGDCTTSDSLYVRAQECPDCAVYVPNAFNPQSTENERFTAFTGCTFAAFQLRIFDRWGNLLFQTHDSNAGWNGQSRGKILSPGVYLYTISGTTDNGVFERAFERSGDLLLVR